MSMQDDSGRKINYLRLSVTDRCDFRCTYCMAEQMQFMPRAEILSLEECLLIAASFVALGVDKIRLTGGEPLLRKNFLWLVEQLRQLDGLRELVLTSNGSQLEKFAQPLASLGVDRINISLDSLNPEVFRQITRGAELRPVLAGIDAAIAALGARNVKLNCVMQRDINHHELPQMLAFAIERGIDISFVEQMPLGETGHAHADRYYDSERALAQLTQHYELIPSVESSGGPARYSRIPGQETRVGFISPLTHNFCSSCNRVRVSARGELFPCLGNEGMVDLLPATRNSDSSQLRELIRQAVNSKPLAYDFDLSRAQPGILRFMSRTGG